MTNNIIFRAWREQEGLDREPAWVWACPPRGPLYCLPACPAGSRAERDTVGRIPYPGFHVSFRSVVQKCRYKENMGIHVFGFKKCFKLLKTKNISKYLWTIFDPINRQYLAILKGRIRIWFISDQNQNPTLMQYWNPDLAGQTVLHREFTRILFPLDPEDAGH